MSNDYTQVELDQLVQYHLDHELDRGTVIRHLGAWMTATRKQLLADEATWPGYINRSVYAITARRDGRRITGWRETRGTHGIDHIPDPKGTDQPPWA